MSHLVSVLNLKKHIDQSSELLDGIKDLSPREVDPQESVSEWGVLLRHIVSFVKSINAIKGGTIPQERAVQQIHTHFSRLLFQYKKIVLRYHDQRRVAYGVSKGFFNSALFIAIDLLVRVGIVSYYIYSLSVFEGDVENRTIYNATTDTLQINETIDLSFLLEVVIISVSLIFSRVKVCFGKKAVESIQERVKLNHVIFFERRYKILKRILSLYKYVFFKNASSEVIGRKIEVKGYVDRRVKRLKLHGCFICYRFNVDSVHRRELKTIERDFLTAESRITEKVSGEFLVSLNRDTDLAELTGIISENRQILEEFRKHIQKIDGLIKGSAYLVAIRKRSALFRSYIELGIDLITLGLVITNAIKIATRSQTYEILMAIFIAYVGVLLFATLTTYLQFKEYVSVYKLSEVKRLSYYSRLIEYFEVCYSFYLSLQNFLQAEEIEKKSQCFEDVYNYGISLIKDELFSLDKIEILKWILYSPKTEDVIKYYQSIENPPEIYHDLMFRRSRLMDYLRSLNIDDSLEGVVCKLTNQFKRVVDDRVLLGEWRSGQEELYVDEGSIDEIIEEFLNHNWDRKDLLAHEANFELTKT